MRLRTGLTLALAALIIVGKVFLAGLLRDEPFSVMLMTALSMAVAADSCAGTLSGASTAQRSAAMAACFLGATFGAVVLGLLIPVLREVVLFPFVEHRDRSGERAQRVVFVTAREHDLGEVLVRGVDLDHLAVHALKLAALDEHNVARRELAARLGRGVEQRGLRLIVLTYIT